MYQPLKWSSTAVKALGPVCVCVCVPHVGLGPNSPLIHLLILALYCRSFACLLSFLIYLCL